MITIISFFCIKCRIFILLLILFCFNQVSVGQRLDQNTCETLEDLYRHGTREFENQKYTQAIKYFKEALSISPIDFDIDALQKAQIQFSIGKSFRYLRNTDSAFFYIQKALTTCKELLGPNHPELADYYLEMGVCHYFKTDYATSIRFYQKALLLAKKTDKQDEALIANIYNNIGVSHRRSHNLRQAIAYLELSKKIYTRLFGDKFYRVAYCNTNIGLCYLDLKNYEAALPIFKDLTYYWTGFTQDTLNMAIAYSNLGWCFYNLGLCDSASANYQKAIEWGKSLTNAYDKTRAFWLTNLAVSYRCQGAFEEALAAHQEALIKYVSDFSNPDYHVTPQLADFGFDITSLNLLGHKAVSLQESYKDSTDDIQRLYTALDVFKRVDSLIDKIRTHHQARGSKQAFAETIIPIYEGAMETAFKLHDQTLEANYLEDWYYFSEKSKSILLLMDMNYLRNLAHKHLPAHIKEASDRLNKRIYQLNKEIVSESEKGGDYDTLKVISLQSQKFDIEDTLSQLLNYSSLDSLFNAEQNRLKIKTLEEFQQYLGDTQSAALEYSVGERNIFVSYITPDTLIPINIPKDAVEYWIDQLLTAVYNHHYNSKAQSSATHYWDQYKGYAYRLYEKIFLPVLEKANSIPPKMIIIPDGKLSYIPFDILLSEPPPKDYSFKSYPYLVRDYSFSYSYSASVLLENYQKPRNISHDYPFAGFAPQFTGPLASVRNQLGRLLYNEEEVNFIYGLLGGKKFIGSDASKDHFLAYAPQSSIVHISSHAFSNDSIPMLSKIAFATTDNNSESGFLEFFEISNIELNCEMITLSMCDSERGKLYLGEGIASIGKSFFRAGARSVVTTLWRVNDLSTATIMKVFYQHLKEGLPKDEALRRAKLDYIQQAADNPLAEPYYWGAAIVIGDSSSISLESDVFEKIFLYSLIFGVVLLLLVFLWKFL